MNSRTETITYAKSLYELYRRKIVTPLNFFKPQDYQLGLWQSVKKLLWIFGGNRSGKTVNGAAKTVDVMIKTPKGKGKAVTWANQSVSVQQRNIWKYLPKGELDYCKYSPELGFSNRVVTLKNGFELRFKTYDQGAASFQSTDDDIIWNDEEAPEEIFREELARLIDRNGIMLNTMTPVNGMTWTYDLLFQNKNPDIQKLIDYWFWDSFKNKFINQEALKNIIGTYPGKEAIVRSKGEFLNLSSGRLYYAFDRPVHRRKLQVNPSLALRLSFDFNVNPMTTTICQIVPGSLFVDSAGKLIEQQQVLNILETVNTEDCNTRMQCELLLQKLKHWKGEIIIYGDASNQRHTESADVNDTNWTIIRNYFPNAVYKVPAVNPNIKERVAWVNAKLMNFNNEIGLFVNEEGCEEIIRDFEQGIWAPDGKTKDKSNPKLNHNSDNLDYIIAQEFPLEEEAFAETDYM